MSKIISPLKCGKIIIPVNAYSQILVFNSPFANYRFDSVITHFLNKLLPFVNLRLVLYQTILAFANAKYDELKMMYQWFN